MGSLLTVLHTVEELLTAPPQPDAWVARNLVFEESRTIVVGYRETFKSFIALQMAFAVASGNTLFGQFAVDAPGPAIVLQGESSVARWTERLRGMAPHFSTTACRLYTVKTAQVNLTMGEGVAWLTHYLDTLRPRLLVIDPMFAFFPADLNDPWGMQQQLRRIDQWVEQYKLAVVIVHHKRGRQRDIEGVVRDEGLEEGGGAKRLVDWCDTGINVRRSADVITVAVEKMRDAELHPEFKLRYEEGWMVSADAPSGVERWVLSVVDTEGAVAQAALAKRGAAECKVSEQTVLRAVWKLVEEKVLQVEKGGRMNTVRRTM